MDIRATKQIPQFMENGGAWMGFHFCGFALNLSDYPQNWEWHHNDFLGAGEYKSNTCKQTSAVLKVESHTHQTNKDLQDTFIYSLNEWYRSANDLRNNPDIKILISIDPENFPLGTGPKLHEIWHSGDYPVVWPNRKFKIVYFNMGHNAIDYERGHKK